jgi:hypothetical protein
MRASKIMKYLGINLTKQTQDLYRSQEGKSRSSIQPCFPPLCIAPPSASSYSVLTISLEVE